MHACNIKARSIFFNIYYMNIMYIRSYIIWKVGLQSKHCVPFNSFVPCHCFWPFLPIECFVVLTELGRSDGSSLPRSKEEIRFEVDQNQVRFHVIDKCFFIQKASLNILVVEWTSNSRSFDNIPYVKKLGFIDQESQVTGMLCFWSKATSQAKRSWAAINEFAGFSMAIVPPAHSANSIRITVLGKQLNLMAGAYIRFGGIKIWDTQSALWSKKND